MKLILERHTYGPEATEGRLMVGAFSLATIERPWIPADHPGGAPFESCVPDGEYRMEYFQRSNGKDSWILFNDQLGVYRIKSDMPEEGGRYAILIHVGNWVTDVVGCIAPGMRHGITKNRKTGNFERAVISSGEAMRRLNTSIEREIHSLIIRPKCGTGDNK